ncbi:glycoside hydrolase family protein [Pantoea eucrina]|uniref:glycoside hydrolase family protein n=1 Tax=Pantoea eucrina TaxID=472693 RepID=UPI001CC5A454|nr:glycoside hydrolase family protein [Pantoea eucrina]UBB12364.1 glycoside hydrolase family protein [Pantoea eucrina]
MTDSKIIPILNVEEGYKETPYLDTRGYPTVAGGIRIGPKGASLSNYTFRVPRTVGDVWKQVIVDQKVNEMNQRPAIAAALAACNPPRRDILISMAYQMGTDGLSGFKNTLKLIADGNFSAAADGMLNSLWAKQTRNRALRHADVMKTGTYDVYKGLI